jgi:hypothetical protein
VPEHLEEGEGRDVDCLGVVDKVRVILEKRLNQSMQVKLDGDRAHTVPGAAPPKLMPPPSKLLNRSMAAWETWRRWRS